MRKPFDGFWPVSQPFDNKDVPDKTVYTVHKGIDYAMPVNVPIFAAEDGDILFSGVDPYASKYKGGYGNMVQILHKSYETLYGHLNRIVAKKGQKITKGTIIAYSGSTGFSTGPHLHFGRKQNGKWVDPSLYYDLNTPFKSNEKFSIGQKVKAAPGSSSNVRSAPGLEAPKVGTINPGVDIEITGEPITKNNLIWYPCKITTDIWIAKQDQSGNDILI